MHFLSGCYNYYYSYSVGLLCLYIYVKSLNGVSEYYKCCSWPLYVHVESIWGCCIASVWGSLHVAVPLPAQSLWSCLCCSPSLHRVYGVAVLLVLLSLHAPSESMGLLCCCVAPPPPSLHRVYGVAVLLCCSPPLHAQSPWGCCVAPPPPCTESMWLLCCCVAPPPCTESMGLLCCSPPPPSMHRVHGVAVLLCCSPPPCTESMWLLCCCVKLLLLHAQSLWGCCVAVLLPPLLAQSLWGCCVAVLLPPLLAQSLWGCCVAVLLPPSMHRVYGVAVLLTLLAQSLWGCCVAHPPCTESMGLLCCSSSM